MTDRSSSSVNPRRAAAEAAQAAAAIRRAADGATDELAYLHAALAARDAELERLQEICDERRRVIDDLTEHSTTYRRAAEERAGLLAALDVDLRRLRDDLERETAERRDAVAAAQEAVKALDEERIRIRFDAQNREAELRAAIRDSDALRTRADGLESALAARAKLIEELQAACDERLAIIERFGQRAPADVPAGTFDWRAEAERRAVLLAEVTAALEGRGREVEDLRRRLARTS